MTDSNIENDKALPLLNAGTNGKTTASSSDQPKRTLLKLLPLALLLMFSGRVIGMYFQPPLLRTFYDLTGLQPGGGTDTPIAQAIEIVTIHEEVAVISEGDVVALGRLIPKGDVVTVTDNALESVCELSNDALLCLDELAQIDPKAAGQAAYMLANGKGKARAGREGQARKSKEWRVLFVSSGEIGLADKIKEGGQRMAAGMGVRVIDLRADAGADMGLFENLHGAKDPASFAQELKAAVGQYYGVAARAWVKALAKDPEAMRAQIGKLRLQFVQEVVPAGADGQVWALSRQFGPHTAHCGGQGL